MQPTNGKVVDRLVAAGLPRGDAQRFCSYFVIQPSGCWDWSGAAHRTTGRGVFGYQGTSIAAMRFSYLWLVGPADGLDVDHLCRRPVCVNPAHGEAVTHAVNLQRAYEGNLPTHCKRGHEFTDANTYHYTSSRNGRPARQCRQCNREREAERRQRASSPSATRGS